MHWECTMLIEYIGYLCGPLWRCATHNGPFLGPISVAKIYFWLDYSSLLLAEAPQPTVYFQQILPFWPYSITFLSKQMTWYGPNWPISYKISSRVFNLVTFAIVKGLIFSHFPQTRVRFWLSFSVAKGVVAKTRAFYCRISAFIKDIDRAPAT